MAENLEVKLPRASAGSEEEGETSLQDDWLADGAPTPTASKYGGPQPGYAVPTKNCNDSAPYGESTNAILVQNRHTDSYYDDGTNMVTRNKFTIEHVFPNKPADVLFKLVSLLQLWKSLTREQDKEATELLISRVRALAISICCTNHASSS